MPSFFQVVCPWPDFLCGTWDTTLHVSVHLPLPQGYRTLRVNLLAPFHPVLEPSFISKRMNTKMKKETTLLLLQVSDWFTNVGVQIFRFFLFFQLNYS